MKLHKRILAGVSASVCLMIVILDTRTALRGAQEGLQLCLKVVIPSIFPFFILSNLIQSAFTGISISFLSPIARMCGIPRGAESIYFLGLIGGYPVGAKSIEDAYHQGSLNISGARRMLGFCSNAGPAFIFGMASNLFPTKGPLWALWIIHTFSSFLVACILPRGTVVFCNSKNNTKVSLPATLENSIKTLSLVCGWVIAFRIFITFLRRWFLWLLPQGVSATLIGLLELTNGCVLLNEIPSAGLRFVLCAVFLSFGGLCVAMQTVSVTKILGTGMYFPGKILQSVFSFFLAITIQYLFFENSDIFVVPPFALIILSGILAIGVFFLYRSKKVVAIPV